MMQTFLKYLKDTKTQAFLAFIIIIGGGLLIGFAKLPDNDRNRIFDIILLTATFYFGSSKSGASKDETIATLAGNPSTQVSANTADVSVKN